MGIVQGGPVPDGGQDVLEPVPLRPVIMDVPRGHHRNGEAVCQAGHGSVSGPVSPDRVLLKLHEDVPGAEGVQKAPENSLSGGDTVLEGSPEGAAMAAGEEDQSPGSLRVQEGREGEEGVPPVLGLHVGLGQEAAEVGVALGGLSQEGEVESDVRGDGFDVWGESCR